MKTVSDQQRCEQEWVEQIRKGDEEAFKKVFYTYYPGLCTFASGYVGSFDMAREVVQEVFLKIWERRAQWHVRTALRAYLFQAVRNQALNYVKRLTSRRTMETEMEETRIPMRRTPEDALHFQELTAAVEEAIRQLPERRRMAFVLHRQHGLSYDEIAQVMNISPRTVEVHVGKALKHLRETIPCAFA